MSNYKDLKNNKFATDTTDTSNFEDTGNEGTKVATGTTAQRGVTTGQVRYNTTTNRFEAKNAAGITEIFAEPTPTSVDVTEVDSEGGGNQTFVITGTNFVAGDVTTFIGTDDTTVTAATTTVNSATQITAVITKISFVNAKEPYDIRTTALTGKYGTLADIINVDNDPVWATAVGNLGTINDDATGTHFTLSATDVDGDTVTYAETTSVLSTAGLSLNGSTGAITGDPTNESVGESTSYSFTVRATANTKTTDRAFSIIVQNPPLFIIATGGTISYDGDYKIHTFPYSATDNTDVSTDFVLSNTGSDGTYGDKIWYLLVAGGAGASAKGGNTTGLGLTAYGGGVAGQNGGALGDGGSGGGGLGDGNVTAGSGTAGPPRQGYDGGDGYDPYPEGSGGGGGAGAVGNVGRSSGNGNGGVGLENSITGSAVYYAGGGGGGNWYSCGQAPGGTGGGGLGSTYGTGGGGSCSNIAATDGTDGLGGGNGSDTAFTGGGGAGGMLTNGATATYDFTVTSQTYTIVVGGGGGSVGSTYGTSGGAGTAFIRYKYQ